MVLGARGPPSGLQQMLRHPQNGATAMLALSAKMARRVQDVSWCGLNPPLPLTTTLVGAGTPLVYPGPPMSHAYWRTLFFFWVVRTSCCVLRAHRAYLVLDVGWAPSRHGFWASATKLDGSSADVKVTMTTTIVIIVIIVVITVY